MTPREITDVMRFLFACYPSQRAKMQEPDVRAMHAAYSTGLIDLELEQAKAAIARVARTDKWLPTIADIRAACGVIAHGRQRSGAEAWGAVMRAMRVEGQHRAPGRDFTFSDPVTARVVQALGWFDLCASENAIADRARFIDSYEQIAQLERVEARAADGATSPMLPTRAPIPVIDRTGAPRTIAAIVADLKPENES